MVKRDKNLNKASKIIKGFNRNNENYIILVVKNYCIQNFTVWNNNDINNLTNLSNLKQIRINLNDKEKISSVIEMLDWITNSSINIDIIWQMEIGNLIAIDYGINSRVLAMLEYFQIDVKQLKE